MFFSGRSLGGEKHTNKIPPKISGQSRANSVYVLFSVYVFFLAPPKKFRLRKWPISSADFPSRPHYLCAKANSPSFFAELTEFAVKLSDSLLRNSTLETVFRYRFLKGPPERPVLLRANFALTKDRKRPYYRHFRGEIHREGSQRVLGKVQMLTFVLGVGVFSLLPPEIIQKFRRRKWPISSADFPSRPLRKGQSTIIWPSWGEKDFGAISGGPFFSRPLRFTAESVRTGCV